MAGAGASDMNQGAEEFFLGMSGDSATPTRNGMSDLFYDGNDTIYHLSTGTASFAGSMLTPYVNAYAAKMAEGKPAATKPTVAEATRGTADDALEQRKLLRVVQMH